MMEPVVSKLNYDTIPQKNRDITFGYIKQIESSLPKNIPYFNIVDPIKNLILLYWLQIFESKLLNDEQKTKFLKRLLKEAYQSEISKRVLEERSQR